MESVESERGSANQHILVVCSVCFMGPADRCLTWARVLLGDEQRVEVAPERAECSVHEGRRHVHVHHSAGACDVVHHVRVGVAQRHSSSAGKGHKKAAQHARTKGLVLEEQASTAVVDRKAKRKKR